MRDPILDACASRLARLERDNRWWRRLATLAVVGLAMVFLTGQVGFRPASIETEQLAIRDASGRVRVVIRSLDTGAAVLTFRDELERDRLAIGVLDDGTPILSLYDEHRRRRLAVGAFGPDAPGIHLYGREGAARAAFVLRPSDLAALEFNGKDGTPRAALTLDGGDPPRLTVVDPRGASPVPVPPTPPR
jgi:hypothetical protein